jgi:hypothetical protein
MPGLPSRFALRRDKHARGHVHVYQMTLTSFMYMPSREQQSPAMFAEGFVRLHLAALNLTNMPLYKKKSSPPDKRERARVRACLLKIYPQKSSHPPVFSLIPRTPNTSKSTPTSQKNLSQIGKKTPPLLKNTVF